MNHQTGHIIGMQATEGEGMEASEIFDLIVKADDALKYATEDKVQARIRQARHLLIRAKDEAGQIGNRALMEQADRRLADLERRATEGEAGG